MRRRLLATVALATSLTVALFGIPLSVVVGRMHRERALISLESEVVEAALKLASSPSTGAPVLPSLGPGRAAALYDKTGRRVAGEGPALADAVTRRAIRGDLVSGNDRHDRIVVAVPVVDRAGIGGLRAAESDSGVDASQRRAWALMALAGLVASAVATVAGLVQARRITAPIAALAAVATRLADGDLAARATPSGIVEIDEAAGALNAGTERIITLLERERSLTSDASHQLRTPLTALRVSLEGALAGPDAELRAAISTAIAQADRLRRTIDELLALARDDPAGRQPLDLQQLIDELDDKWYGQFAGKGRPFTVGDATEAPLVRAAHGALSQALDVLVDNALHHGTGAVQVRVRHLGGGMAIEVEDEGAGVSAADHDLFRRHHGVPHGIGLPLARSLVEAEGGRLLLTRRGPRPVFTIALPSADDD